MNVTRFFGGLFLFALLLSGVSLVAAQSSDEVAQQRAAYERELKQIEAEIAQQQALLNDERRKASSVERDLAILEAEIDLAQGKIRQQNFKINNLEQEIGEKTKTIYTLDERIERGKESLAQLVRQTHKIDETTTVEIILSNESLSNVFEDVDTFVTINRAMKQSFDEIRGVQVETSEQRSELRTVQRAEIDARAIIESEKRKIEQAEAEKQAILDSINAKAGSYESVIAERNRRAAEIRSALFALRDSASIPFGDALDFANAASAKTGVRPALILAVLEQESDFGENIGSCYLRDAATGDGVGKNTGTYFSKVMKPTRDVAPFLEITERLGLDPFNTPVSCPWSGGGYGGAMGPSQFIPSTWEIFKDRIAAAIGVSIANPWQPEHAIMATAIYMGDLGATNGYTSELNAACRYYSGRICDNRRPANTFYGTSVLEKASRIQATIDELQQF